MDARCLQVQEAISRAADGDKVTADEATLAKRHCAECAECAAFARVLVAMRRHPVPDVAEQTVERALSAVRDIRQTEKLETARAAAAARATALTPAAGEESANDAGSDAAVTNKKGLISLNERDSRGVEVVRIGNRIISQQRFVGLVASAAVLLLVIVVAADQGVRVMRDAAMVSEETASDIREAQDGDVVLDQLPAQDNGAAASAPSVAGAVAQYVTFEDRVYRYMGVASGSAADLSTAGTVRSALDTGDAAANRNAYTSETAGQIIIENEGSLLNFSLVTRTFGDNTYALKSESITAFGEWPSLPNGIPEPSSADGGSTFDEAGTDDLGVAIFTRPGRDPESGFAVAPGTASGDPASGNPDWTWWEPVD